MKYLKLAAVYGGRLLLHIFYIFPVKKNRIYLTANRGTSISDNPLYIYRYLRRQYPGEYRFIWEGARRSGEADTKIVSPRGIAALYYQMTAKVLISNDGFGSYLPKRRQQLYLNTWHGGGAYKKSGVDFITDQHPVDLKINRMCGQETDLFISSCRKFSEVMSHAKMVPRENFLEVGMPRNDLLVNGGSGHITAKVKEYFHIAPHRKLILYAPTYRGEEADASFDSTLDIGGCIRALQERFGGEWEMLVRKHHFVRQSSFAEGIDASEYPDMQELLYAADAFITDYSSSIWDYSLTFRPGFLFTPDISQYSAERSFYTDPETWAFPLCPTNEELQQSILTFDQEANKCKIRKHHELLGSFDHGQATEQTAEQIVNWTKGV